MNQFILNRGIVQFCRNVIYTLTKLILTNFMTVYGKGVEIERHRIHDHPVGDRIPGAA